MKSRLAFISAILTIALLLWPAAVANAVPQAPAAPSEVHVCSACDYTTVQAGIDAVASGGVVKIATGTYSGIIEQGAQKLKQVAYIRDKAITLDGGYTPANWTTPDPVANLTTIDAGGGGRVVYIFVHGQTVTLRGLHLTGGDASKSNDLGTTPYGGGIWAFGAGTAGSALNLINNQISGNTTTGTGAGLEAEYMTVNITGNTFSDNSCASPTNSGVDGGGANLWFAPGQVSGNTFDNNTVPIGSYYGDSGGGLSVYYSTVTISGNVFQNNQAEEGGGLAELRSSLTVTGNQFLSNKGTRGGGIYFGSDTDASITLTLTRNHFHGNTVTASGGAAWLTPYQIDASDNVVDGNTATANSDSGCQGAGLEVGGSNQVVVERNTITNNTANTGGGGLCLSGTPLIQRNLISGNHASNGGGLMVVSQGGNATTANPVLINNVIINNTVTSDGSAIADDGSWLTMIHNTLSHNTGGDASIVTLSNYFNYGGGLSLTNTIFASQTTGVSLVHNYSATLNGVLWDSVSTHTKLVDAGSVTLSNERSGSAAFASDGYHLKAGSAAIDHGVASSVTQDFDGQKRPVGSGPDLGADEYYPYRILMPALKK